MNNGLEAIFNPKSVAVIGATEIEGKVGQSLMKNLKSFIEKGGNVYPINKKYEEVYGLKCYDSVLDVPGDIDLVLVSIPAKFVPETMEECGKKGVKGSIIITAGFSEVGDHSLEEKTIEILKKYNIRTIGPNCLGVINMHDDLNASFSKDFDQKGNIAFISQSGAIMTALMDISIPLNLGYSKIVSMGNKIDVQEDEILDYLADDENTDVVVLYVEGLKNEKFIDSARALSCKKPVIVLKSGKSDAGAKAASSHTGSLAGNAQMYEAAFKKGRVFNVETFEEMVDLLKIFSTQPVMKGNNVGIITNAGGFGVLATDMVSKYGLNMAEFEEKTINELKKYLPDTSGVSNPLDLIGDADTERYKHAFEELAKDSNVDGIVVILTPQGMTDDIGAAKELVKFQDTLRAKGETIPIVAAWVGGNSVSEGAEYLKEHEIPTFMCPELAVKALSATYQQYLNQNVVDDGEYLKKVQEEIYAIKAEKGDELRELLANPNENNAKEFLKINGVPTPGRYVATSAEEAVKYASTMDKVVMKVVSAQILHKSDAGCVIIAPSDIEGAYNTIIENGTKYLAKKGETGVIDGVLIEEFVEGKEIIIGGKRDEVFGPVIMTGLGGIFVEVMKDVTFGVHPITKNYAEEMLQQLRTYKILEGVRGEPKRDIEFIKELIVRVGVIMEAYDEIQEIDINPVFVKEDGKKGVIGDALIMTN
ncbi:acetyl-CoA synthetase (ADP-forming)/acetyltransferase [Methanococcus voltae]|uniref:acetate--CoA ligase (ADP-forming) n=1 Tax=Methanococcus voltae TaxID=2188 RepID=A0A8J7RZQ4_METVO|nr:acetate--CoA ligase [Methanococcus voltae]MBP2200780.1 acetyl-CoA synthetase (ADP-forming)/acetyltransferase [Methanococcus voltae]